MSFTYHPEDERSESEQRAAYFLSLPKHHPERLEYEAEWMPWKETARFDLGQYSGAIDKLRKRGYSYAEIASWLVEKTGQPVNRGHVYRAYQSWLETRKAEVERDVATGRIETLDIPSRGYLGDDEAEKRAAEADENIKNTSSKRR